MNTHQIVEAYDLLRQREDLQAELKRLPPADATMSLARVSLELPAPSPLRAGSTISRGPRVEFAGPTINLIVDMLGSQLTRQIDAVNKRLGELGVTEDMAADIRKTEPRRAEPDNGCAAEPQDPAGIEIMVFGVSPCDCPLCQAARP